MPLHKIVVLGLDNSGKTTLTKFIKDDTAVESTTPTLSFNIDNLIIKDIEFVFWDSPGQVNYRNKWKRGVLDAKIILFLLDTSDSERFEEAKKELDGILTDLNTRGIPLIFCFHKMDLQEAKDNYVKARELFKLQRVGEREVQRYQTSVHETDGVKKVKDKLVEIIEKERWG